MIWSATKRQLRSVIEWKNADDNVFELWTENGDEIKNASKLIVNPGQGVVFTYEGQVKAVWTDPGKYELTTDNIPFITTLKKFMQAFESDHKVGVYFFRTAQIVDQKWGTAKPVKYMDPHYKFPVELKAFGNFSVQISDGEAFFVNIVASATEYTSDQLKSLFQSRMNQPMNDYMAESKFTYTEIDANLDEMSLGIKEKINIEFETLGFKLVDFRISGTSFDEKTLARINKIADATAEAQALGHLGISYDRSQQLEALKAAASNEGGGAGIGMGLGAGLGAGQAMGGMFAASATQPAAAPQPVAQQPVAQSAAPVKDPMETLKKLKAMVDNGLITQEEFDAKKKEILASM